MEIKGDCVVHRDDNGTAVQGLTSAVRFEWYRVLTDKEVRQVVAYMTADPYQAFRPSPRAR